jgi:diguanylate cyclase (GGDEF)-like protein/PAS domain S-box-containing protein
VLLALLGTRQIVTLLDNVALNGLLHTKIQLGTAELRQREARFSALAEHASDLITIVGEDSLIHYQSPSILRTLGRDPDQLLGTRFDLLLHPQDRSRWLAVVGRLGTEPQGVVTAEWRLRHRDDTWRTFQSAVTNLVGETSVAGYVVNSRDITDQRGLEDQLRDRALHDALTGLANRALFAEHLERASRRQHRSGGSVQVMIIDLDDFGAINEEFGHAAGDELLTKVALRLQTSLRDADSIGRLGGDEFGVLFEFPGSPPPGTPADRVVMSFSKPFTVRGQQVRVTSSIGIAANASDCRSEGELMRRADLALHAAKAQGKQTHVVYAPELHGSKLDGVRLDRELRQALERGEFELHYQPIVHIETGDITGVEALIRWNSPKRGPVSPLEFIPEAESSGLIRPIGEWVIREACRETRDWRDGSGAPLRVSVNVSPQQLRAAQFPGTVLGIVAELAYDPRRLTLEVTETLFAGDATLRSELLAELRSSGMRVAIDDFGTGYSSLSLLRDLPVDVLKIDKSFIDHIIDEPESARVVRTILRLAEDFHLSTVAEGVEDRDQLALLRLWGCHFVQGFYFSRPLGSHAMERVLLQERPFDVLFEQPAELIGR